MAFMVLKRFINNQSFLFVCLLLLSNISAKAQNWKRVGSSEKFFSNLISKDKKNWSDHKYEYFKKDSDLVIVDRGYSVELFKLFNDYPNSFDSILLKAQLKEYQDTSKISEYESTLKYFTFRQAVIVIDRHFINGHNEYIWQWKITHWYSRRNPCYINVVFDKKKEENKKVLKFISVVREDCEI